MSKISSPSKQTLSIEDALSRTTEQLTEVIAALHKMNHANENSQKEIGELYNMLGKHPQLITDEESSKELITEDVSSSEEGTNIKKGDQDFRNQNKKNIERENTSNIEERIGTEIAINY